MKDVNVNTYIIYVFEDGSGISIDNLDEMSDVEFDALINIVMGEKKFRRMCQ